MQVTTALLCDFAQVREGLLFVASGGVSRLYRPQLPGPLGLNYAIVVTLDQIEMQRPHEMKLVVMAADGQTVAEISGAFQVSANDLNIGEKQQVPIAVDLRDATLTHYGAHTVSFYIDGNASHETSFYVVESVGPSAYPGG